MRRQVAGHMQRELDRLATLRERPCLADPHTIVTLRERDLEELTGRMRRCHRDRLDRGLDDVTHARARVRALSPLETLRRGYTVLQTADGHVVSRVDDSERGDALTARVSDGRITVRVEDLQPDEHADPDEQHEEVR
jgi:exodeoxyribonuclease VII large subunit